MCDSKWRTSFIEGRIGIVRKLTDENVGGTYAEAILILTALISATAAKCWPKRKGRDPIDRKRFVETIHRFAGHKYLADLISTDLLVRSLEDKKKKEAGFLKHLTTFKPGDMPSGADISKPDSEITRFCPSLEKGTIRNYCYSSLLYDLLRSPYVHEYRHHEDVVTWILDHLWSNNMYYRDSGRLLDKTTRRYRLYFGLGWIAGVAHSITQNLDEQIPKDEEVERPDKWWIDGG
ncbi:MAG: hypothetical protein JW958_08940 [Candidatus Eisenbacteria bacterium]|nr:hypothetical protein [Candidatus Eisenbacteria bacterium]